jgi:toxin ParE1/3/4
VRRLRLLNSARRDLAQIYTYIEGRSASTEIAERFVRELNDQCRRLAQLPGTLGRGRPELTPDIRSAPFRSYMIFFRDIFEVVRIVEGHRDIDAVFGEGKDD